MTADAIAAHSLRDRTQRHERRRRREKVSRLLRFGLAFGAVVGVGVGVTTAAWEDSVLITAKSAAAKFQMQYSYTHKETEWCDFSDGSSMSFGQQEETPGVQYTCSTVHGGWHGWVDPNSIAQDHLYFFRNTEVGSTTYVTVIPELTDMLATDGVVVISYGLDTDADAALTPWNKDTGYFTITVPGGKAAKVLVTFTPAELPKPTDTTRSGTFKLDVTGRVGGPVPEGPLAQ